MYIGYNTGISLLCFPLRFEINEIFSMDGVTRVYGIDSLLSFGEKYRIALHGSGYTYIEKEDINFVSELCELS